MPLIEGIGNEVVIVLSVIFGGVILLIAWFSTSVRDYPWRSIIIVQYRRGSQQSGQSERVVTAEIASSTLEDITQSSTTDNNRHGEDNEPSLVHDEEANNSHETEEAEERTNDASSEPTSNSCIVVGGGVSCESELTNGLLESSEAEAVSNETDANADHTSNARKVSTGTSTRDENVPVTVLTSDGDSELYEAGSGKSSNICSETRPSSQQHSSDVTHSSIMVRLKFLNESERIVPAKKSDTIGQFRR